MPIDKILVPDKIKNDAKHLTTNIGTTPVPMVANVIRREDCGNVGCVAKERKLKPRNRKE